MKKLLICLALLTVSLFAQVNVLDKGYLFPLREPTYTKVGTILCTDWCSNIRVEKGVSYHYMALNYPAPYGSEVLSPADGIVESTHVSGYEGATITILFDDGVRVTICHLSEYKVLATRLNDDGREVKTRVKRGQVIGYVGTSGRTTGPHIRIRFEVNGERAFANSTTWGMVYGKFDYRTVPFKAEDAKMYRSNKKIK